MRPDRGIDTGLIAPGGQATVTIAPLARPHDLRLHPAQRDGDHPGGYAASSLVTRKGRSASGFSSRQTLSRARWSLPSSRANATPGR